MAERVINDGLEELRDTIASLIESAEDPEGYIGAAVQERGFSIIAESKKNVPVDTGRLRASGYVASPEKDAGGIFCEIGHATEYAMEIHQNHSTNDQYLADAIDDKRAGYPAQLARAIEHFAEEGKKISPRGGTDIPTSKRAAYVKGLKKQAGS